MRKFDTKVQLIKYSILRSIVQYAFEGTLLENLTNIPKEMAPGPNPTVRCCIYKERAIVSERVSIALSNKIDKSSVVTVLETACDGCPGMGYTVSDACRGCLANRCSAACHRGAIVIDHNQKAHINKEICVECGLCAKACPYNAIVSYKRPCQSSCPVGAISINKDTKVAQIDPDKCIECGTCVYQCPFGALVDKSFIIIAINILKAALKDPWIHVYAAIAPAIASQFTYAKLGQVITGLKKLGFYDVVEVALGADMVALAESRELEEKGFLTTSCCPAFVSYVQKHFPSLSSKVSTTPSPMATIGRAIKQKDPQAQVIFIGPCIAKKREFQLDNVKPYVDCVLTFEELQALFDGRDIDITELPETKLNQASYYGRIFARSGGVSEAVSQALKEGFRNDFHAKPVICNGIAECKRALLKVTSGRPDGNIIEGMACTDGCISGAGCLTHGTRNKSGLDQYGQESESQSIVQSVRSSGYNYIYER